MHTSTKTFQNITWVNILKPEKEGLSEIFKKYSLPNILQDEIFEPTLKTKAQYIQKYIYLSIHFPFFNKSKNEVENIELDVILSDNFILTSYYDNFSELEICFENFENFYTEKLRHEHLKLNANIIFEYLLKHLYKNTNKELDAQALKIKSLKEILFNENKEAELIQKSAELKASLFEYKSILKIHKNILSTYMEYSKRIWSDILNDEHHEIAFSNEYNKIINNLENQNEFLADIRETADMIINYKDKQLTRLFTSLSFIILPLTFLSGFLGMNTLFPKSFTQDPYTIVFIMFGMLFLAVITTIFLKIKKYI
jgi:magnesium transporter